MKKIAAVQMKCHSLDISVNLNQVLNYMSFVGNKQVDLVVFPECILTGYVLNPNEALSIAQPIDSPWIDQIVQACKRYNLISVIGCLEKDKNDNCYNSAFLIGPVGLLSVYRKTHLPRFCVDQYLSAGDQLSNVVKTPVGTVGMLICFDILFPETVRVLALNGAEMILVPSAWSKISTYYPDHILRTRSFENGVYIIAADRVGEEQGIKFLGRSMITGIDGQVISEANQINEEILIMDIEPEISLEKKRIFDPGIDEIDIFRNRRPALYAGIVEVD